MIPDAMLSTDSLLASKVRVPHHVVYRSFPSETVVLNLQTGKYHGLNATAGKILETLEQADSVRAAATALAVSYGQEQAVMQSDVCELCRSLLDRGLIEADVSPPT